MVTETFTGKVESAYGKTLPTPVSFSGSFEKLQNMSEVPADERLTDSDILDVINGKRKASARAKATTEALTAAGYEKPDPNSPEVIRANNIKLTAKQFGVSEEVAAKILDAAAEAAKAL